MSTPETPEAAGTPETPETPGSSEASGTPKTPGTTETPGSPAAPGMLEPPETPESPGTRATPATSGGSATPAADEESASSRDRGAEPIPAAETSAPGQATTTADDAATVGTAAIPAGPRRRLTTVAYALSGVAVLACAGAAFALPSLVAEPAPRVESIAPVELAPGDLTLVCPGAPVLPTSIGGGDVSYDPDLGTGDEDITLTQRVVGLDGARLDDTAVAGESGPRVVTVTAEHDQAARAIGLTSGYTTSGDLRGLVAAPCQLPSSSAWFVGGDTEIGSSTQLVLTNPGDAPVKVSVEGWTALGPMPAPHTELVLPGETVVVLLEVLERSPRVAVHVGAEGGRIAAHLQTSTLDGLTPMGVAYITSATPPQPDLLLGPIHLAGANTAAGDLAVDPAVPVLQLLNPGQAQATVSVTLLGPDGPVDLSGATDLILEPGTVNQLPLAASTAGAYAVQVSSDEPITGAVRTIAFGAAAGSGTDGGGSDDPAGADDPDDPDGADGGEGDATNEGAALGARDIGWLPAGYPVETGILPVLTTTGADSTGTGSSADVDSDIDPTTTILVTNPTPADAELTITAVGADGRAGATTTIDLPALTTAPVPVPEGAAAVQIDSALPVLAAAELRITTDDGDLIELVPATSHSQGGTEVKVVLPGR